MDTKKLDSVDNINYPKVNFDIRLAKSISVKPNKKYFLCINCDVSIFNTMQELSSTILKEGNQPQSLFANDWQEKLHVSIHSYMQEKGLSFNQLSQNDKKHLTRN